MKLWSISQYKTKLQQVYEVTSRQTSQCGLFLPTATETRNNNHSIIKRRIDHFKPSRKQEAKNSVTSKVPTQKPGQKTKLSPCNSECQLHLKSQNTLTFDSYQALPLESLSCFVPKHITPKGVHLKENTGHHCSS